MIKKLLYFIFVILFIGCSNKDKTSSDTFSVDYSKGLEQFNKRSYVSVDSFDASSVDSNLKNAYLWVSIKYNKLSSSVNSNNTDEPDYLLYSEVDGKGIDYTFSIPKSANQKFIEGSLTFSEDGSSLTIKFTRNILYLPLLVKVLYVIKDNNIIFYSNLLNGIFSIAPSAPIVSFKFPSIRNITLSIPSNCVAV